MNVTWLAWYLVIGLGLNLIYAISHLSAAQRALRDASAKRYDAPTPFEWGGSILLWPVVLCVAPFTIAQKVYRDCH